MPWNSRSGSVSGLGWQARHPRESGLLGAHGCGLPSQPARDPFVVENSGAVTGNDIRHQHIIISMPLCIFHEAGWRMYAGIQSCREGPRLP